MVGDERQAAPDCRATRDPVIRHPPPKKATRPVDDFEREVRLNLYLAGQALDAKDPERVQDLALGIVRLCLKHRP